jgi:hypothetical protein
VIQLAAPYKQGLDYYPRDIGMMKDRKFRKPRMKHGYVVNDVYDALLDLIYGDKGYYLDYSEPDDVIWEIQQYIFGKYQVSTEEIAEIIEELAACGLFSGDCFRSKILTSKRIQQVFYKATVDRRAIDINFGIWLLSASEMKELSSKSIILEKFINRPNNGVNQPNNEDNQPINPQSREKESKGKDRKGEEGAPPSPPTKESLYQLYGKQLTDVYLVKAARYRRSEEGILLAAAEWLAKDTKAGTAPKGAMPVENSSLELDEYEKRVLQYVPVFEKR